MAIADITILPPCVTAEVVTLFKILLRGIVKVKEGPMYSLHLCMYTSPVCMCVF